MANYFEYTAGREGDHAVTMCRSVDYDAYQAQRVDFDTANQIGKAGGFQCEKQPVGSFINHNGVDIIPVCMRPTAAQPWQAAWTTPSNGNQAWNYGLDASVAHAYQSTVLPLASSECQEPVTQQQTVAAPPAVLPATGMGYYDYIFAATVAVGFLGGWLVRSFFGSFFDRLSGRK